MNTAEPTREPAAVPGDLWGARARDWAEIEDEGSQELFERVLDELGVGKGTKLLDVGCGSGLACAIAAGRGAEVSGLDASPGLLEIARERAPDGDFRLGDMQSLPWEDDTFDAVTFFNSIFFADKRSALGEAERVSRAGAQVAVVVWTAPERVEVTAYLTALEPLLPPLPTEVDPFVRPEELDEIARRAGLHPRRAVDVDWTMEYPDLDTLLRGWLSVGLSTLAVQAAGEDAVRDALAQAAEPFRLTDGGYRLENVLRCHVATA